MAKTLTFNVARKSPELIAPAKPTPHELKLLSDIDDQDGLRFQATVIQFYRRNPSMEGKDPVKVIRGALAKALVSYYPLAGRLREAAARKLVVDCTAEGVLFIEADADVALDDFGDDDFPAPCPRVEELLYDVPGSSGILDSPVLLIQVTRLRCGGFVVATRGNHTMCDAAGYLQFMSAVAEFAGGAEAPSVEPVWERHLLSARDPPRVTCTHREYDEYPEGAVIPPPEELVSRSFFFGAAELAALRRRMPPHLRKCPRFELVVACLWRCRTIAISPEVRIMPVVNSRGRFDPPLPQGYYGNAIAFPVATTTAGEVSRNPLHYAVEVVRKAKALVGEEYMKSTADLMVTRGRPLMMLGGTYMVSDLSRAGLNQVDYGWGKPVFGGPADVGGPVPQLTNYCVPYTNKKGDSGIVVPVALPPNAMEVFALEMESMLQNNNAAHKAMDSKL